MQRSISVQGSRCPQQQQRLAARVKAFAPTLDLLRSQTHQQRFVGRHYCCSSPATAVTSPTSGNAEEELVALMPRGRDPDRPTYHVAPLYGGWINDPNGPIQYRGRYHIFYQHLVDSCEWDFGLVWGHAVSSDLVHWEHLPPALVPTPGSSDANGCFSGCAVLDEQGRPTILYTGVRLRSNGACGPLPPVEQDLNLPFIESQCIAMPLNENDDLLQQWQRVEQPFLELPPLMPDLAGWRDPFIFEVGGNGKEWGMLIGTGYKGRGGSTMVYRSSSLHTGWRFVGMLCEADSPNTGIMWECPILIQLNRVPESRLKFRGLHKWNSSDSYPHLPPVSSVDDPSNESLLATSDTLMVNPKGMLSIDEDDVRHHTSSSSPYTHLFCVSPDAPTNPVIYWVGSYDSEAVRFDLENAKGPFKLDLGDVLYAPNVMTDDRGRHLMWGWLQERRRVGAYDYSGCLSIPRTLFLRGDKLVQEPVPEVSSLRKGETWHASDFVVYSEEGVPLQAVAGEALEIEVTFSRHEATAAGLHFKCWRADSEDAVIVVDWHRQLLEAVFTDGLDVDLVALNDLDPQTDGLRHIGGPIDVRPNDVITLRIFVDHSCIEVFASTGEVLSTRVYRGAGPIGVGAGIEVVSYGGAARVESITAWEMSSIWSEGFPAAASVPASVPASLTRSLTMPPSMQPELSFLQAVQQHPALDNLSLSTLDSDAESEVEDLPVLQFTIDTVA